MRTGSDAREATAARSSTSSKTANNRDSAAAPLPKAEGPGGMTDCVCGLVPADAHFHYGSTPDTLGPRTELWRRHPRLFGDRVRPFALPVARHRIGDEPTGYHSFARPNPSRVMRCSAE